MSTSEFELLAAETQCERDGIVIARFLVGLVRGANKLHPIITIFRDGVAGTTIGDE